MQRRMPAIRPASFGPIEGDFDTVEGQLRGCIEELEFQLSRQAKAFPRRRYRELIREAQEANISSIQAQRLLADLVMALEEFSPAYGYFAYRRGVESFGYWLISSISQDFDGLRVSDLSEVPRSYRGEVLHVSDHGNLALYVRNSRGFKEVWAVV
jgi:hypothetical protein